MSMDGRGRVYDNIFVERLWRSVKYEEVYLHDYQTVPAARIHLSDYFLHFVITGNGGLSPFWPVQRGFCPELIIAQAFYSHWQHHSADDIVPVWLEG